MTDRRQPIRLRCSALRAGFSGHEELRRRAGARTPGREQAQLLPWPQGAVVRRFGALDVGRRSRAQAIAAILPQLPVPERIIDFGCGRGLNTVMLAKAYPTATVVGVDIDPESIRWAQACAVGVHNVTFLCGPETGAPMQQADLVLNVDVLEHIDDDEAFVRQLVSLVRPGGSLIVHTPLAGQRYFFPSVRKASLDEVAQRKGPHLREGYTPTQVERLLRPYFARIESTRTICGLAAIAADLDALGAASQRSWLRLAALPLLALPPWGKKFAAKGLLAIGANAVRASGNDG